MCGRQLHPGRLEIFRVVHLIFRSEERVEMEVWDLLFIISLLFSNNMIPIAAIPISYQPFLKACSSGK